MENKSEDSEIIYRAGMIKPIKIKLLANKKQPKKIKLSVSSKEKTENIKGTIIYTATDGKKYRLTDKEKKFCESYLEFKGNGVDAIFEAGYNPKNRLIAAAMAYENLRKPHIFNYINLKLEEYGFGDENVEKQHLFLLNQQADFNSKGKAIDMFYKLKGKYAKKEIGIEHKWSLGALADMAEEEE